MPRWRAVRFAIPVAAILLPAGFFLSVLDADAVEPNRLIDVTHGGAVVLAVALVTLGVGLLRERRR